MRRLPPAPPPRARPPRTDVRTYVVFGYPLPFDPHGAVTIVGTVQAADRRAARPLAFALARQRGHHPGRGWAVRWWAAGVCRRSWLIGALARDGAALRAAGSSPERA